MEQINPYLQIFVCSSLRVFIETMLVNFLGRFLFRIEFKEVDDNIDHHEHINIPVRFYENRTISKGCTQAIFKINGFPCNFKTIF